MLRMDQLLEAIRALKPPTREDLLKLLSPVSEQELDKLIAQATKDGFITDELMLTKKGKQELTPDYDIGR